MKKSLLAKRRNPGLGKKATVNPPHHCAHGRVKTFTRTELAALFGVPFSELTRLGRYGAFKRLGVNRYLLDYQRSLLLLSRQDSLLAGIRYHQGPALPIQKTHGSDTTAPKTYQKVSEFYPLYGRFQENTVNIMKVPDLQHATLAAGMFLAGGLQNNDPVALVSFEHPEQLFSRLAESGLNLADALQNEQLVYLYYKPDVAHSLSLSADYRELFRELTRLGGEGVKRLALFNVDALINTNSEHLVHTSLHQLMFAANHFQVTLLGLFVAAGQVGELLDEGCRSILPGYYVMD